MKPQGVTAAALFFILILEGGPRVFGDVKTYTWQDKLKRGSLNIVSSPVEVAREIHLTTNEGNLLKGWTVGLVKGLGEGFVRFGAGAIDVVTCPFDFPDSEKAPLLEPEYVWQKPGPKYA